MELILKQTIDTLGEEGALVNVKPGYGRNYLIPRGLAALATKAAMVERDRNMAAIQARLDAERNDAESIAKKIDGTTITITMRSGEDNKLYGSVTSSDLADKLAELSIAVDKRKILLDEPLKNLGEFNVSYKAGYQVFGEFKVLIVPFGAEKEPAAPTTQPKAVEVEEETSSDE